MSDLISRQAAIDALVEEKGIINGILDSFMLGNEARKKLEQIRERLLDDIEIIAELPSAQPSYTDEQIQKMQELEQAEIEKAFQLGMESAQQEPIRLRLDHELSKEEYERLKKDCAEQPIILLPKESAQQWIPCSERLPEALQEVLVTSINGRVYTSRIVHGDFEYGGNVVAWMPLPEPYKPDDFSQHMNPPED